MLFGNRDFLDERDEPGPLEFCCVGATLLLQWRRGLLKEAPAAMLPRSPFQHVGQGPFLVEKKEWIFRTLVWLPVCGRISTGDALLCAADAQTRKPTDAPRPVNPANPKSHSGRNSHEPKNDLKKKTGDFPALMALVNGA